jgi:lipopolysaccharide biosynthesis regulator YciM
MNQRPVTPTVCPHCGHSNGGMFWLCPICKRRVIA